MQSILLCAGFGTRLKPLTELFPKPAVPFMGHPMVWYAMHAIQQTGQTQFAANVHYLPQKMTACLTSCAQNLGFKPPAIFHEKDEILGTGGGARACFELLPKDDCYLIFHGDVLCNADLNDAYKAHKASKADVTLVVAPRPQNSNLGMIGIDKQQQIAQIRDWFSVNCDKTSLTPACFTGIHIVNHHILANIPNQTNVCFVTEIYRNMLETGQPIHAYMTNAFFADIGTPQTYLDALKTLRTSPELLPGTKPITYHTQNIDDWPNLCHTLLNGLPESASFSY